MYRWRTLDSEERQEVLAWRQRMQRPLQSLPHLDSGQRHYLISASCYNHQPHIGYILERMNAFADMWLKALAPHCISLSGWVVLPNHYHVLLTTCDVRSLLKALGQLHGRTSFQWNGEENCRGRQVWCNAVETVIKSSDHFNASVNYVHHNPVKHGYISKWTEWPWSSASDYLQEVGQKEALRRWRDYPITRYGQGWDDPEL